MNNQSDQKDLQLSYDRYYGLGAVLPSVSQAYWINFAAYYLCNLFAKWGNTIFLFSQLIEALGILIGWIILQKLHYSQNICNRIYIVGAIMVMLTLPIIFLPPLTFIPALFLLTFFFKIGSGFMIISQLVGLSKITENQNQKRKLVQKMTQYGLTGIFISLFIMTFLSTYVSFIWKYFIGVGIFTVCGGICSILYAWKIRIVSKGFVNNTQPKIIQWQKLKQYSFYLHGTVFVFIALYLNVIMGIYPYFIRTFKHITQFKYLNAIVFLYLSALFCSIVTKNSFIYIGVKQLMSTGLLLCALSTGFFVFGFVETDFGLVIFLGTCLAGISKVIAVNSAFNMINEFDSRKQEFTLGVYYFFEKIIVGLVLYGLFSQIYLGGNEKLLNFSWIYLPFILYSLSWMLVMLQKTINFKELSLSEKRINEEIDKQQNMQAK